MPCTLGGVLARRAVARLRGARPSGRHGAERELGGGADVEQHLDRKLNTSKFSPEAKIRVRAYLGAMVPTFDRMQDEVLTEFRREVGPAIRPRVN
jgi:hypothetical protein